MMKNRIRWLDRGFAVGYFLTAAGMAWALYSMVVELLKKEWENTGISFVLFLAVRELDRWLVKRDVERRLRDL